ncbi:tyrosine-type recombinase/integrase [Lactococcus lactis]|uniref:tyrosine-type recombinase/integrase n=1 Tax=Lactococcus lactis TaxID=1358 RepID=UPI00056F8B36|nr:site-specific integrase [Lactococcus lactis]
MNIKGITKKDGTKVYRTNVYLGVDSLTGKQVRTSVTAKSRKMCETKAHQAINNFINNGSTIARKKVVFDNFKSLALSWFESYKLTVILRNYILPPLGSYKLSKITPVLFQELVNKWAQNANTAEIVNGRREKGKCKDYKLLLNFIKRILDFGMQLGAIEDNPATKVFPPKLKTRTSNKIKYFDNVELKQFLTYLDTLEPTITNQKNITIYKLLLTTGLRVGEALALSWSDINFSDKSVSITKTLIQQSNVIQEGTKTKESNRILFLDSETIQLLKVWQKNQNDGAISLHDSLVFPYHQKTRTYELEKLKLVSHFNHAGVPNIGFHDFRHTHASLLINNDVNLKEIQRRLGHADYAITMNTYSHLAKSKEKETAEKFGNILKAL